MHFTDYFTVFKNILKNFSYLKSDFIGIKFDADIFINFVVSIFIATFFIILYFRIGRKIRLYFFKNDNYKNFANFIDLALGYIFINSILAILGMLSLLYPAILWTYIGIVLIAAFYPFRGSKNPKSEKNELFNTVKSRIKSSKLVFLGVFLFVFIAFLRLIPPETGEDAIGYHTGDPHLFLKNHTTIIPSKASLYVVPAPHLGEMSYVLSEFIGFKDSARYIHFSFYFLVVLLLILINPYAALFFVTSPVVIQISSKANVDFQWILCWLLSIFILTQNKSKSARSMILTGILFGGVLASKLWTIAFLPLFILHLLIVYRKLHLIAKLNILLIFSLSVFLIDSIWFWRSYLISGNPVYPMFSTIMNLDGTKGALGFSNLIGFNKLMFNMKNVIVFSPLFYFGIVAVLLHWRSSLKILFKSKLSLFFIFLATEYLFVKYHFGRYLLGLYSLAVLVIAAGVNNLFKKYYIYKIIFIMVFGIMFIYYFTNTLLILPYGFGWADNNKYLTRVLARDNASYFDFDHLFNIWISTKDVVATYNIYGYYYANFNYIDVNNVFDKDNKSFDLLLQKNVTKVFINGGDILWFCSTLDLHNCDLSKVKLLASYPERTGKYYLYSIFSSTRYIR